MYEPNWKSRFGEHDITVVKSGTQYKVIFGTVSSIWRDFNVLVNVEDKIFVALYGSIVDYCGNKKYEHIGSNVVGDFNDNYYVLDKILSKDIELKQEILKLASRYEKLKAFL